MIKIIKISLFVSVFVFGSQLFSTDFICGPKACADQQKTAALIYKFEVESFKKKFVSVPNSLSTFVTALGVGAVLVILGKYVIGKCNAWYERRNNLATDLLVVAQLNIYALIASQFSARPHFDHDDVKFATAPAA